MASRNDCDKGLKGCGSFHMIALVGASGLQDNGGGTIASHGDCDTSHNCTKKDPTPTYHSGGDGVMGPWDYRCCLLAISAETDKREG